MWAEAKDVWRDAPWWIRLCGVIWLVVFVAGAIVLPADRFVIVGIVPSTCGFVVGSIIGRCL